MSDVRIPVKAWLKAPTYRALANYAHAHDIADVGTLLEQIAESSVHPRRQKTRRTWVRMTPERLEQLVRLHAAGFSASAIALELGVSPASVSAHSKRLGLSWDRS